MTPVAPVIRRILTVWCHDWPVVAAARQDEPAVVLSANRVVARSPAAAAAGITIGSRRRDAQRRCPDVTLVDHDPDRDARAFEPVIRAVGAFVPRLEVTSPGMLCLDAKGPARYFGGEQALADGLIAAIDEAVAGTATGTGVGLGLADGRFASAIAAHWAAGALGRRALDAGSGGQSLPVIVPAGTSPSFLAPLSVRWLDIVGRHDIGQDALDDPVALVDLFVRLGLTRLGDVAATPERDLLARFGRHGVLAHRLASGVDERPPGTVDPPPDWAVSSSFEQPVEQLQPVVFAAKSLADGLAATLSANGQVCTRLVVIAETDHGERSERVWYRATGMTAAAMVERVRWQLDGWIAQPGGLSAGIVLLRLISDEVRSDDGEQPGLWGGRSGADDRARHAITRLAGLVGEDGVRVPVWRGGRLPGERYGWLPAVLADLDRPGERLPAGPGATPWPGALPAPSPPVVLAEPEPLHVVDAAGGPVTVTGRGVTSAPPAKVAGRQVTAWAGPWPVEQRWWEPASQRRLARFQVVLEDGAAQLLVVEHQQWWLLATYG